MKKCLMVLGVIGSIIGSFKIGRICGLLEAAVIAANKIYTLNQKKSYKSYSSYGEDNFTFDDVVIDNEKDAKEVLDIMHGCLRKYGVVTVADLYELVGITPNFKDNKYGWKRNGLREASVTRTMAGYLINLPQPTILI